ncbi:hypothetical protein LQ327_09285 [Actinomycetospora endophytica]|uniref:PE family protein n=1 Tax=Actinomycetospora endophytica TaxID=2291215 RepID=A0ABS8P5N6_9PSEU|nr:hypothetical protein [Actinomycetospora endophytica]MCD2193575.1 hypothetical protein [Actinomycetospora endophytica]
MSTPVPPPGLYTQPPTGPPPSLAERPVGAADPAVLTDGQVVPRQVVPAPTGGGAFSVDLDRAPEVLQDLENARQELIVLRRDALRLGQVDPSSNDQVSRDAAAVLGAVAVGGPGSLVEALDGGIERLAHLIGAISAELGSYSATEQGNGAQFDRA